MLVLVGIAVAAFVLGAAYGAARAERRYSNAYERARVSLREVEQGYERLEAELGVELQDGEVPGVLCPDCGVWAVVRPDPAAPLDGSLECCEYPVTRVGERLSGTCIWEPCHPPEAEDRWNPYEELGPGPSAA